MSQQQKAAAIRQRNHDDALRWLLRDMTRRLGRAESRLDRIANRKTVPT